MGICVSCRRRERKAPENRWVPGASGYTKGAAAELLPRRWHLPAMANSISNIKMTNPIKGFVSKRRKRYIKDGFNLDLAYITDRLIAMGFPAEKLEGVYRNHIDEVYRFLEQKHRDHYKIYNLCSERTYDTSKFHERVSTYPFEDHTPPNIGLIQPFCEDVHKWLNEDTRNVAAVHCKAGKGRTGTMVCCYLLFSGQKATADEALKFYGTKRTHDEKGVTIPSQRRYVEYYAALVRGGGGCAGALQYRGTALHVRELLMSPPPALNGGQCTLELTVAQADPPFKATLAVHEVRLRTAGARVSPAACTPLKGDVRVDVYCKPKMMRKERLFHFWFNTFFVAAGVGSQRVPPPPDSPNLETFKLTLNKWQLDDAHKDKQNKLYSPDFKVELVVQKQPESSTFSGHTARVPSPPSSTASSCSEPDTEHEGHWDSGTYRPLRCDSDVDDDDAPHDAGPDDDGPDDDAPHDDDGPYDAPQYAAARCNGGAPSVTQQYGPARYERTDETRFDCRADACDCRTDATPYDSDALSSYDGRASKASSRSCNYPEGVSQAKSSAPERGKASKMSSKDPACSNEVKIPKVSSDHAISDEKTKVDERTLSKPRLSLGDMRASWREFSGKFGDNRKKKNRDDC